jgi:hypothetical protein
VVTQIGVHSDTDKKFKLRSALRSYVVAAKDGKHVGDLLAGGRVSIERARASDC